MYNFYYTYRNGNRYGVKNRYDITIPAKYLLLRLNDDKSILTIDENLHVNFFDYDGKSIECRDFFEPLSNINGYFIIYRDFAYCSDNPIHRISDRMFYINSGNKWDIFTLNELKWEKKAEVNNISTKKVLSKDNIPFGALIGEKDGTNIVVTDFSVINLPKDMKLKGAVNEIGQVNFIQNDETGIYDIIDGREICRVKHFSKPNWKSFFVKDTGFVWFDDDVHDDKMLSTKYYIDGIFKDLWQGGLSCSYRQSALSSDMFILEHDKKSCIININTEKRSQVYDSIDINYYSKKLNMFRVKKGNYIGYIDMNFNEIFRPEYDDITPLKYRMYLIRKSNRYGIANHEGKIISNVIWNYPPLILSPKIFFAQKCCIDITTGKIIFQNEFDKLKRIEGTLFKVTKNNLEGIFDFETLEYIVPLCKCYIYEKYRNGNCIIIENRETQKQRKIYLT